MDVSSEWNPEVLEILLHFLQRLQSLPGSCCVFPPPLLPLLLYNPEVKISKEAINEPLRASVAIQMTVAVEQKSCSSGASRGSGDPTVRRITLNIWVCLNVCVNTPSGLMCSVEFWLHLGSTETHRQRCLRSNTYTHTYTHKYMNIHTYTLVHTHTCTHTIPLLVYLFFTSFSFSLLSLTLSLMPSPRGDTQQQMD